MDATARASTVFGIVVAWSPGDEDPQAANSSATDRVSRQRDTGTECQDEHAVRRPVRSESGNGTRSTLYQGVLRERISHSARDVLPALSG